MARLQLCGITSIGQKHLIRSINIDKDLCLCFNNGLMASLMEHIQFYPTVSYVPRKILECASSLRRAVPYEA